MTSMTHNGPQITGGAGTDTLVAIEGLSGSAFGDVLVGDGSANLLLGVGGNDTFNGGAGNDTLEGGAGNDSLDGGGDIDRASYASAAGPATLGS